MSNQEINAQLLAALKGLLEDVIGLMGESDGVYGLHLNGDVSPWSELDEGGEFERLSHLSVAQLAIAAAEAEQPKSTLEKYNELMSDCTENDPLERLRFFCSLAMNSQDWLDVERFFIDLQQPPASEPDVYALDAARYQWLLHQAWFQEACDRFDFEDGGLQNRFEKCVDEMIDRAMLAAVKGE